MLRIYLRTFCEVVLDWTSHSQPFEQWKASRHCGW